MIYMFQLNGQKQLCVSLTLNWTHGVQSLGKHLKREIRFLKKSDNIVRLDFTMYSVITVKQVWLYMWMTKILIRLGRCPE